jgi:hypothetical protein
MPEVKEHCSGTSYILVGMKSDLRDSFGQHADEYKSKGMEWIPAAKGEEMKKAIGAHACIECSARMQFNLKEVFEEAIKVILHPPSAAPQGKVKMSLLLTTVAKWLKQHSGFVFRYVYQLSLQVRTVRLNVNLISGWNFSVRQGLQFLFFSFLFSFLFFSCLFFSESIDFRQILLI